ncbi:hypothetical protein [Rhodococcus sp. BH4]|uniref:hypothetical protein n=1 Tax=Rhodococcus sp. BH4 TaxID=1807790 RepID=UPI0012EBFE69|nr:hypothetical protein [Rhodococcus sp. BH4]
MTNRVSMTHEEWVQRVLDEAPPLSEDQKDLLRRAFFEVHDRVLTEEKAQQESD